MNQTAYQDTFAADHLPPRELWPDLINLDQLGYPEQLNCAAELLDRAVAEGDGDRVVIRTPTEAWTYRELFERANRIPNLAKGVDGRRDALIRIGVADGDDQQTVICDT